MEANESKPERTCIECDSHIVIKDSDPDDWFCDDDVAVLCSKADNPIVDSNSRYMADRHEKRAIAVGVRPYNTRKEATVPVWCPKEAHKVKIVGVAIVYNSEVVSLPEPARHGDVIRYLVEERNEMPPIKGQQGFVDEAGRFLSRESAYTIAINNGQFKPRPDGGCKLKQLFSEDLW